METLNRIKLFFFTLTLSFAPVIAFTQVGQMEGKGESSTEVATSNYSYISDGYATILLEDSTLNIYASANWYRISIEADPDNTVNGYFKTISSDRLGFTTDSLEILPGKSILIGSGIGAIDSIRIVAPTDCILQIFGVRRK